jgi:hypothetical protein
MTNKHIEQASWDENIEHYPATPDWFLIIGVGSLITFGIVALIVIL